ncbi:hypothetical protein EH2_03324 [Bacillus subtilis]|nr:hypothetical protein EH2_03324 [Bacillus subtilis]
MFCVNDSKNGHLYVSVFLFALIHVSLYILSFRLTQYIRDDKKVNG